MTYNVKYTNKNKVPIEVAEASVNNTATDISLTGRERLDYGADMNATLLHILENFACYEDPNTLNYPDLANVSTVGGTTKKLLQTPTQGQRWFNKTKNRMFVWTGAAWNQLAGEDDIGVNWGTASHGDQLPLPAGFSYNECVWIVSPAPHTGAFEYMLCYTDTISTVTMEYGQSGGGVLYGDVSYTIVGIRGNVNYGHLLPANAPSPSATPVYVTPTPTPTITLTVTPTPTVGTSPTPTPTPVLVLGGALQPFGDIGYTSYNVAGPTSIGFVVNGLTANITPAEEDTRLSVRSEGSTSDIAEAFWVNYGTVLGDEASVFGTDYWVYVQCTVPSSTKFTSNTGNFNQWVNIGTTSRIFGGITKPLASPTTAGTISTAHVNGNVYMKQSASMPAGSYLTGTFMGTFSATVFAGEEI